LQDNAAVVVSNTPISANTSGSNAQ
jgi:hypothetical protein